MSKELICHDFKTPRRDASGRLPNIFMLVPVLFYLALLGGTALNVKFYLDYRKSVTERDNWKRFQAERDTARAQFEVQLAGIESEARRAGKLAEWIETTRTMQPICMAVARSVPAEISLSELSLERAADMASRINLAVRINGGTTQEVGRIQEAIVGQHYRPVNSQQIKNPDNLEFRTMLVREEL